MRCCPLQHIVHVIPIRSRAFHSGKIGPTVPRVVAKGIFLGVPFALLVAPWAVSSFTVAAIVHKRDPNQVNPLGLPVCQVSLNIRVRS